MEEWKEGVGLGIVGKLVGREIKIVDESLNTCREAVGKEKMVYTWVKRDS